MYLNLEIYYIVREMLSNIFHTVSSQTTSYIAQMQYMYDSSHTLFHTAILGCEWLVGCFGFNGPLRQYFSLCRAVSQREGERVDESKNVQTTPPAPNASAVGPCPTVIQIVGRPGTGSLPRTIAPPYHPQTVMKISTKCNWCDLFQTMSELSA